MINVNPWMRFWVSPGRRRWDREHGKARGGHASLLSRIGEDSEANDDQSLMGGLGPKMNKRAR